MPELPEVEYGRRIAERALAGKRVAEVRVAEDPIVFDRVPPERFRSALRDRRVRAVRRWGKQLWFELDAPPHPLFHFGMSGGFRTPGDVPLELVSSPAEPGAEWPPRFWKVLLIAHDGTELAMTDARRLGRILLRTDPEREPPLARLGFDPLLAPPSVRTLRERLAGRRTPIKSLLLDQSFSAGVGNWIADEVLFQAGIDPRRHAHTLDEAEVRRLRAKLLGVVKRAVACTTRGAPYPAGWLFHRRWGKQAGQRTARGDPIEHLAIGGRTTAWVPTVQR
jgi:formamidopyrimidine-DNA glycosylase